MNTRITIMAFLGLLYGCSRVSEPTTVGTTPTTTSQSVEQASSDVVVPEPLPESTPEPEKINIWDGVCYTAGTLLWKGEASEITKVEDEITFYQEPVGKKVIIWSGVCVWRFQEERVTHE